MEDETKRIDDKTKRIDDGNTEDSNHNDKENLNVLTSGLSSANMEMKVKCTKLNSKVDTKQMHTCSISSVLSQQMQQDVYKVSNLVQSPAGPFDCEISSVKCYENESSRISVSIDDLLGPANQIQSDLSDVQMSTPSYNIGSGNERFNPTDLSECIASTESAPEPNCVKEDENEGNYNEQEDEGAVGNATSTLTLGEETLRLIDIEGMEDDLLEEVGYCDNISELPPWTPPKSTVHIKPPFQPALIKDKFDHLGNAVQRKLNNFVEELIDNGDDSSTGYVVDHEVMSVLDTVSIDSLNRLNKPDKVATDESQNSKHDFEQKRAATDAVDVSFINDLVNLGAISSAQTAESVPFPMAEAYDMQLDKQTNETGISLDNLVPSSDILSSLPQIIVQKILSFMTASEMCHTVMLVCKTWYAIAHDPVLWQHMNIDSPSVLDKQTVCLAIKQRPLLKKLTLHGCNELTISSASTFTKYIPNLLHLELIFCDTINAEILLAFARNCRQLVSVNLEGCEYANKDCIEALVTRLPHLQKLNLSHCTRFVTDDDVIMVSNFIQQLVELNIDGISNITDRAVDHIIDTHQNHLEGLIIDGAEISDSCIKHLKKCRKLKQFSVSFAELLTDQSLFHLKEMRNSLRQLKLKKGAAFSTEALMDLFDPVSGLHSLTLLDLTECTMLQDEGIYNITKGSGKHLRELYLCWCWSLTDNALISIVDNCPNLCHLDITGLDKVTGTCLDRIPEDMTNLTYLDLRQCNNIIDELIQEVVRRKKDLTIINYYGEEFSIFGDTLYVTY